MYSGETAVGFWKMCRLGIKQMLTEGEMECVCLKVCKINVGNVKGVR